MTETITVGTVLLVQRHSDNTKDMLKLPDTGYRGRTMADTVRWSLLSTGRDYEFSKGQQDTGDIPD